MPQEFHYNQHGLLLLEGRGIYRLGDSWLVFSSIPVAFITLRRISYRSLQPKEFYILDSQNDKPFESDIIYVARCDGNIIYVVSHQYITSVASYY